MFLFGRLSHILRSGGTVFRPDYEIRIDSTKKVEIEEEGSGEKVRYRTIIFGIPSGVINNSPVKFDELGKRYIKIKPNDEVVYLEEDDKYFGNGGKIPGTEEGFEYIAFPFKKQKSFKIGDLVTSREMDWVAPIESVHTEKIGKRYFTLYNVVSPVSGIKSQYMADELILIKKK